MPHVYEQEPTDPKPGDRRYRIKKLSGGSDKYGSCEVCGEPADPIYLQAEMLRCKGWGGNDEYPEEPDFWSHHDCKTYFGHAECLRSKRR